MPHQRQIIRPTILQTAESILRLDSSKWIYHEGALATKLGLSLDQLHSFMQTIVRGGSNVPPPYNIAIDLDSGGDNILNLHRMKHGDRSTSNSDDNSDEEPSLTHLATGLSTYYQIGRKDTIDKRINIKTQLDLIKMVTGTHPLLDKFGDEYKSRRQQIWKEWIEGSNNITSALYTSDHLPYIALHFRRLWDVTVPLTENVKEIPTAMLELVKKEIVDLFVKMFVTLDQFTQLRRSTRNSFDMEIEPANARKRKHSPVSEDSSAMLDDDDDDEEEESIVAADGNEDQTSEMKKTLDLGSLKQLWCSGEFKRVGALEIGSIPRGGNKRLALHRYNFERVEEEEEECNNEEGGDCWELP